ncbi:hypothetical protein C8Q80DRAFT_1269051 [Daedaleopsis nitida]|nr:hypothetical protein C8Q80DRAFT_1269051 [Daedaleopsis nitida]
MQFKTLLTIASAAALAVAAPNLGVQKRDDDPTVTLTTHFTTETFVATRILQSFITVQPWVKTITTETTWTVAHTVTRHVPTPDATPAV